MRRLILLLVFISCAAVLTISQDATRRYVAVKTTPLKSSTGFFGQELRVLSQGDELVFLRADGKWTEVRAGNQTGWVSTDSLSSRRVVASGSAVTASEVALAGKGFSAEIEVEYRKSGIDYSMVDFMEKINIPANELLGFVTDGRLARGE